MFSKANLIRAFHPGRQCLAWVRVVGAAAVPDGNHAYGPVVSELVDDAVDPDPVGPQPPESSTQLMTEVRVALKLTERIQHRSRT